MHVAVIVNPIAGSKGRDAGRFRAELAARLLADAGTSHEILVTERGGHARELAEGAVRRGATVVCAWGGDGTVNEVATTLVGGRVPLAIVPAGSGNGLARELGVPFAPAEALKLALGAAECRIDVGEFGGRRFMNMAGVGFDAAVSARFAAGKRRGFVRYLSIAATGMRSYRPARYDVAVEGVTTSVVAWMIVLANSRQYRQRRHHRAGGEARRRPARAGGRARPAGMAHCRQKHQPVSRDSR